MSEIALARWGKRRWPVQAVKVLVIAAIFAFLLWKMYSSWGELHTRVLRVNGYFVAAAMVLQVFQMCVLGLLWRELMAMVGQPIGLGQATRMQWLAAMGKYIPGKVAAILGKVYLADSESASRKAVALGCAYEGAFCFSGASLVILGSVICGSIRRVRVFSVPAIVLLIVVMIAVHPRVMIPVANWALARFHRQPIRNGLSYWQTLFLSIGYMMPFVLGGMSEFALLQAFFDVPAKYVIDVIGITAAATTLGFVALFAPAGLGVREGVMSGGLEFIKGVTLPGAILVALAGRLMGTVIDLITGAAALVMYGGLPRKAERADDAADASA